MSDEPIPRSVLVLGSTGSIGTQALDVVTAAGGSGGTAAGGSGGTAAAGRFTVAGLAAGGGDVPLLAAQARAHGVRRGAGADRAAPPALRAGLPGGGGPDGPGAATRLPAPPPPAGGLHRVTRSPRPRPPP